MSQLEEAPMLAEFKDFSDDADFVYHLTLLDRLSGIERGLKPNPHRGKTESWRAREALLDEMRPEEICLMGISRGVSVYAHPDFDAADGIYGANSLLDEKDNRRLVTIAIAVDPEKVLVCDAFDIGFIYPIRNEAENTWDFSEQSRKRAQDYWSDAVTLKQYRELYDVVCDEEGLTCSRKDGVEGVPNILVQPEVLIPGPVDPSSLQWVSSSLNPMSRRVAWQ